MKKPSRHAELELSSTSSEEIYYDTMGRQWKKVEEKRSKPISLHKQNTGPEIFLEESDNSVSSESLNRMIEVQSIDASQESSSSICEPELERLIDREKYQDIGGLEPKANF